MKSYQVFFFFFVLLISFRTAFTQANQNVKIWEETITLPTYLAHPPDENPIFFRNQSYQGASKVLYPYPLMDNLSNVKENKDYTGLFLENEYIKLCVLPEIGGRLFYATDKTNGYEIFYRQHVIKPSNIGMLGAWTSGGIEFCVFHHHRASTFLPVDYRLVENQDGSKTIWIGELEPRHRMRWAIGISLHPGKSYLEVDVRMYNRTETTNSILYWANVATHVNDDYQVIFPPSTDYAVYHAKNSFAHWPNTQETYRGLDYYQDGRDASWWKNHPNSISMFAHDLKEGFLAGYDHGKHAGTMHVANHHIAKGAKLWEWGPGPRGSMWDTKVLTDSDGPYAELMAGAYSDNQPDYSWIKPYETKQVTQYWYPIRDLAGTKNANRNAAVNFELRPGNKAFLGLNVTQAHLNAQVVLTEEGKELHRQLIDISPAQPYTTELNLPAGVAEEKLKVTLNTNEGEHLISYQSVKKEYTEELPEEVQPPLSPSEIKTIEELYLTGLRIKQFHNARLDPMDYFQAALKQDPGDIRTNIQVGLDYKKRGMEEKAAKHFRQAIQRLTKDYTRPRDCEALYQLGLILKNQGKYAAAYDTLYRALWDYEFRGAAYYQLAQIDAIQGNFQQALEHVKQSLYMNAQNTEALGLKSAILRHLEKYEEAKSAVEAMLIIEPLNHLAFYEQYLIEKTQKAGEETKSADAFRKLLRNEPNAYLELATTYMHSGLIEDGITILKLATSSTEEKLKNYPIIHYYRGYFYHQQGEKEVAKTAFNHARQQSTDYCFPFRMETAKVLATAIENDANDPRAHYYLGNIFFDHQPEKAMEYWDKAIEIDPTFAIAHRNLGWGYNWAKNDAPKAIAAYETAIKHDPTQARYYYELDLLYDNQNASPKKRMETLSKNHQYVAQREDALSQEIAVLVLNEKYDQAIQHLNDYFFHIMEGSREFHDIHVDAHLLRGIDQLKKNRKKAALADFLTADEYPENHQVGRDPNYSRNPQVYYYIGLAYEKMRKKTAREYYEKAIDQKIDNSEYRYYQGLALQKTGKKTEAKSVFEEVLKLGEERLQRIDEVDYFTKFGSGLSRDKRLARAHFTKALGLLGLGQKEEAAKAFEKALKLDQGLAWAKVF